MSATDHTSSIFPDSLFHVLRSHRGWSPRQVPGPRVVLESQAETTHMFWYLISSGHSPIHTKPLTFTTTQRTLSSFSHSHSLSLSPRNFPHDGHAIWNINSHIMIQSTKQSMIGFSLVLFSHCVQIECIGLCTTPTRCGMVIQQGCPLVSLLAILAWTSFCEIYLSGTLSSSAWLE